MAEAVADPRRREVRQGLVSRHQSTGAQGSNWLPLPLQFFILVERVGMRYWWPEEGLGHSRAILEAEIGYLDADFGRSLVSLDPAQFTKAVAYRTSFSYLLSELTRVAKFIEWVRRTPAPNQSGLRARLHIEFRPVAEHILAAVLVS
jgi:hypothetical protein